MIAVPKSSRTYETNMPMDIPTGRSQIDADLPMPRNRTMLSHARRLAILATLPLLAACTTGGPPAVPPLTPETVPLPPVSAEPLRWRPGHWHWTGAGYAWVPGQYVPHAGTSSQWMHGYWTQSGGGMTWHPGRWAN
jgi:hypothetical protein